MCDNPLLARVISRILADKGTVSLLLNSCSPFVRGSDNDCARIRHSWWPCQARSEVGKTTESAYPEVPRGDAEVDNYAADVGERGDQRGAGRCRVHAEPGKDERQQDADQ